jgi:hypothetical protein
MSDLILGEAGPATDDTPTVISKGPPAHQAITTVPSGEVLGGSVRGRRLAHFELIEPIGVGGMAAVLRARDTQLDRIVALKILPPEMAGESENVRRFHQEARAAARLDHENIARVFFCGEDQRLHFIAFEFVEGENLRTLLERRGRLPVAEALHYMLQIAAGLDHAAARGVVHRDIKPSNIIISPNGRAKLVDMGLARSQGPQSDKGLTQSGVTLGTFDYISPEQALEPRDADVRSDIYSLGCTFYHTLTGQPPVPDGTAAKKLHHHQHVPPLDPRLLNPEVPDAVAAILARMMAKDPKDRYQRPEHLVQHLLQVAQQVGAPADVPPGVLFVDAPLPTPPQKRLGLLAALAAGGLAAVLLLLSFLPAGFDSVLSLGPGPTLRGPAPADRKPDKEPPPAIARVETAVVRDENALRAALKAQKPLVKLAGTITLSEPLTVKAATEVLTLESADPQSPAIVRAHCSGDGMAPDDWAGLLVKQGSVTFRNLRFELDVPEPPDRLLAGVAVTGARQVTFQRCSFVQRNKGPAEDRAAAGGTPKTTGTIFGLRMADSSPPVASVAVQAVPRRDGDAKADAGPPVVTLDQCFFAGGHTAVHVRGSAQVISGNCAFGPHGVLFHVHCPEGASPDLLLRHCSAFVRGPAFRIGGGAGESFCYITVNYCLFSNPDSAVPQDSVPCLIRQTSGSVKVKYAQTRACYHNLYAFLVGGAGADDGIFEWTRFEEFAHSTSPRSTNLPPGQHPWQASDPLGRLDAASPFARANQDAFRINARLPELREGTQGEAAKRPLGVQQCVWGSFLTEALKPLEAPGPRPVNVAAGTKVVDPKATVGVAGKVYKSLNSALADARPGDVILLRVNGPLPVEPVAFKKPDLRVTIRADKGYRPVLQLSTETLDYEAALFRLPHGELRLEQVAVELNPGKQEYKSLSVVTVAGGGLCVFKECLFTLRGGGGTAVSVATLEGSDAKMMPMTDTRPVPRLHFQDCFIRGAGDLVRVPQSRPVEVKAEDSAVALAGSFLVVGDNKEPAAAEAQVQLRRVTTYLKDHLIRLEDHNTAGKGLVKMHFEARDCLFASAAGRSLVHLDGEISREQMERVFDCQGEHNAYSGFVDFLDIKSVMQDTPPVRLKGPEWGTFAKESEKASRFVQLKFDFEAAGSSLAGLRPGQLRPQSDETLEGYGADLDRLARLLGLLPIEELEAEAADQ